MSVLISFEALFYMEGGEVAETRYLLKNML